MPKIPQHPLSPSHRSGLHARFFKFLVLAVLLSGSSLIYFGYDLNQDSSRSANVPANAQHILQRCHSLNALPGPPSDFHSRLKSDRFVPGTQPVLIKNATIWTGRDSGYDVVHGNLFIESGIIKAVGHVNPSFLKGLDNLVTVDAGGAWVTPGIVDMHSHLGVDSVPELKGSDDTNSLKGLVMPWLRSLDGLNTHDEAYQLSISGGVTTANVLPGSADAIGGQAFVIKLRPTHERTASAMLLEPPFGLNGTEVDPSIPPRWRQMKHACGENPSGVYSGTRMDTIWAFREGYEKARQIKKQQDDFCGKALHGQWNGLGDFPEDLQWEALVDVLRGHVKVHNHCYEATDLDGIVRLTNEFKFSIAAFHHAHETYLVPDLLKKAYGIVSIRFKPLLKFSVILGHPPAIALFATNARYKREAYRGSEFAPRILAEQGLQVVMKSDHPVLNSRYLLYEAQQAHYYGLSANLAIASVTSTPATVIGQDHRIGFIRTGYDADIVIWDSHPLKLGAAPQQVYIDGIPQLKSPYVTDKPSAAQVAPKTPNFDQEAVDAVKYDGLPPLLLRNLSRTPPFSPTKQGPSVVVVKAGRIACTGTASNCLASDENGVRIDLQGGSILPAYISYGSPLGLTHIADAPSILGGGSVIRAIDGLQFESRDALLGYRAGVTNAVTAPSGGYLSGLSVAFGTGSTHKLAVGAIIQDVAALHISIGSSKPSISTQIGVLRRLLLGQGEGDLKTVFKDISSGKLPLVVTVQSADIMATLIQLKKEVEKKTGSDLQLVFSGANEAHILAKEIGENGIGVILTPSRPFPTTWKSKRIVDHIQKFTGPPLTKQTSISALRAHNVTTGIGIEEAWSTRNVPFDIAWALAESEGVTKSDALALGSVNLEKLLGIKQPSSDLIAVKGGSLLDFEGKVAGIISPLKGVVELI
ncbi:hypothetical protein BDQ17DRAFT_1419786 [Cyathus striatus]|nr:hypothetical protein BDQ17DRAFT_1419786 [Cyathus striatus]